MSFAWQVSDEDIATVLARHGHAHALADDARIQRCLARIDAARVETAVLAYTDFDEQATAALAEVEAMLLEAGEVQAPARFTAP